MDTNSQPVEQANQVPPSYQPAGAPEKKVGPIVAILVIVVILVAAAIYMFANRVSTEDAANTDTATTQEVQQVTNTSDEVSSLEADLGASVSGLDEQNF